MERLAAEMPEGDAVGLFERGAAFDSTGSPDRAVPLYEAALAAGLEGERRRRAVIQMASSLRNLGDPGRALELLRAEAARPSDGLDDAVATFTALALVDLGREREAVGVALTAPVPHLPRYNRSVARYAGDFADRIPGHARPPAVPHAHALHRTRVVRRGRARPRLHRPRDRRGPRGRGPRPAARAVASGLPWAVENLRFCSWCDQMAPRDLNDCPTCGRRMAPLSS